METKRSGRAGREWIGIVLIFGVLCCVAAYFVYRQTSRLSVQPTPVAATQTNPPPVTPQPTFTSSPPPPTVTVTLPPSQTPTVTLTPTPVFIDVEEADRLAVEAVWKAGIIPECGTDPLRFCPDGFFLRGPFIRGLDVAFTGSTEVPDPIIQFFKDCNISVDEKTGEPKNRFEWEMAAYGIQAINLGILTKPYWCSQGEQYLCPTYYMKVGQAAAWIEEVRLLKASNSTSGDSGEANLFLCKSGGMSLWPQRPCVTDCGDHLCKCDERCSTCPADCGSCPPGEPPPPPPGSEPTSPAPGEPPRQHYVEPDLPIPTSTPVCVTGFEKYCVLTKRVAAWLFAQGLNLPSPTPSP